MKRIKLNVCQGVGDIFWVYQKFAPYYDKIDFSITVLEGAGLKTQTRAIPFLELLPKIGTITADQKPLEHYTKLATGIFSMKNIMEEHNQNPDVFYDYACNKQLEDGIRIENIDPDLPIEEKTNFLSVPCPLPFNLKEYITLYVSGGTLNEGASKYHKLWSIQTWTVLIKLLYKKYRAKNPIILIGASYDEEVLLKIQTILHAFNIKTQVYIDSWSANVIYILQNSKLFIGFQSGLNILADNLDVQQIMMYFPTLEKMMPAWCKKQNFKTLYHPFMFTQFPIEIVRDLKINF